MMMNLSLLFCKFKKSDFHDNIIYTMNLPKNDEIIILKYSIQYKNHKRYKMELNRLLNKDLFYKVINNYIKSINVNLPEQMFIEMYYSKTLFEFNSSFLRGDYDIIESDDKECPICLNNVINFDSVLTDCNHVFHGSCLIEWVRRNNTCPMCRTKLF